MRKSLAKILRDFSNEYELKGKDRISRSSIIDCQKLMHKCSREAREQSKKHLQSMIDDIDLAIIGITSFALSCLEGMESQKTKRKIVLADFPANDLNLGNCLLGIANTAQAIEKLCLEGFDTQARALLRTLEERLLQTPVLFASSADYKRWHEADTPAESKAAHYDVFARKQRLRKRYTEIETACLGKLAEPKGIGCELSEDDFYSMAVHGASSAVQVGSWAYEYDSEIVRPNIFGVASSASVGTLRDTRNQIFWFTVLFPNVLAKFHNWKIDKNDNWQMTFAACHQALLHSAPEWNTEC